MKFAVLSLFLFLMSTATGFSEAKRCHPLKIAIVDTGLDFEDERFSSHLCEKGHKNFVIDESIKDVVGHGTHVAGIIQKFAKDSNYCFLIYKYYEENATGLLNLSRLISAIHEAVKNKADIVNLSGGGPQFSEDEYLVIKNNPKTTFVVAAGNEHQDIDLPENHYYPASYRLPNEVIVGNGKSFDEREPSSNWGANIKWEPGKDVISSVPCFYKENHMVCEASLSGTSMSTARYTGKLINKINNTCISR